MSDKSELGVYREAFTRFAVRVGLAPYSSAELDVVAAYFLGMGVGLDRFDGSCDAVLLDFTLSCWGDYWHNHHEEVV
jgi:hypothetical protein